MFGFFSKKEMDRESAIKFWDWFSAQEADIIRQIESHESEFIWDIDAKLKPVFPYFHKELEFQLGFDKGTGEFFFFHFGKHPLMEDAKVWAALKPESLNHWKIILDR